MRTRSAAVASKPSLALAFSGALALAGTLAACSSAGTNADPSFDQHGDSVGDPSGSASAANGTGGDDDGNEAGGGGKVDSNGGSTTGATTGDDDDGGSGSGSTAGTNDWTNVYATLFAAKTEGHCGNSGCHDVARHGFACGTSADACYEGMITAGLLDETNPAGSELGDATHSPLSWFRGGKGMPIDAPKVDGKATAMITTWLEAGAPNHGVALGKGESTDGGEEMDASTHEDASTDAGVKDSGTRFRLEGRRQRCGQGLRNRRWPGCR